VEFRTEANRDDIVELILEQDPDGDFFDCEEPDSDMYDN
jgi:hypothetical protein